ncbi:hypothetical protein D7B24_004685 [Verticillium nonalfalfae]|uniref:Uncharacterized protein n=1 Tax=Verticillium nonalfalfae TaxID=1051616 RepID=A0A3M9YF63_9PEZI|nr:uncharacterized protein D7B24_004685 [Verticillium nonalfalfae]RNJ58416.1 hypothetical protein D7B24_004685 [Verticillium nonalfalfae]
MLCHHTTIPCRSMPALQYMQPGARARGVLTANSQSEAQRGNLRAASASRPTSAPTAFVQRQESQRKTPRGATQAMAMRSAQPSLDDSVGYTPSRGKEGGPSREVSR